MANITIKAKKFTVYNMDNSIAYTAIKIPRIKTNHCDMNAMRQHKKFGAYANSNMFEQMINAHVKNLGLPEVLKLNEIPEFLTVKDGFFTIISFEV